MTKEDFEAPSSPEEEVFYIYYFILYTGLNYTELDIQG